MKKNLLSFFLILGLSNLVAQVYPSLNMTLIKHLDPETNVGADGRKYSGCWGWYRASKSKEYAIVGTSSKTYFIDITNPNSPVINDSVMAKHGGCTWREIKNYQNYCYVVSDDAPPNSFQIIDMQYLPDSVHVVYDGTTYFERAHTIWVDGNKLYAGGVTLAGGGAAISMQIYSLATPSVPVLLRTLSTDFATPGYVHDMFVQRDTIYASGGWSGLFVFKYNSGANNFTSLGSLTTYTQSGYNHSSSIKPNGQNLIFCDEAPAGLSIKVADVTNLANITLSSIAKPNSNPDFVAHNPYVVSNKHVYISCYQDGLIVYDISNPTAPFVAGFFDTYPQGGANFGNNYGGSSYRGNWGAYPWFSSGVILACDMQNGIFLLRPNGPLAGVKEESNTVLPAKVYPNPATNSLNLTFANSNSKNYSVQINNVLGQIIYNEESANDCNFPVTFKTIDVADFPNGTYVVTIKSDNKTFQQKFIISK